MFRRLFVILLACIPVLRTRVFPEEMALYWKSTGECEPFERFMRACNMCVCGADGAPSCTRLDCTKDNISDEGLNY